MKVGSGTRASFRQRGVGVELEVAHAVLEALAGLLCVEFDLRDSCLLRCRNEIAIERINWLHLSERDLFEAL